VTADSVGRSGGYGEGPSEARRVSHLAVGVEDSIHVFKPLGRNVFDSEGRFARDQRDPVLPLESNVAVGGREIHAAFSPGHTTPRPPLVILAAGGRAPATTLDLLDDPGAEANRGARRVLDRASSSCLAVGRAGEYRVDVYDESLELQHILERTVPWFEPWDEWELPLARPPEPRVVSVMADCPENVVWVAISVAEDTDFTPLDPADRRDPLRSESRTYDTVVEVLDMTTGRVLASRRFASGIGPFNAGGFVLQPFVGQGGEQQFRVLRLSLVK